MTEVFFAKRYADGRVKALYREAEFGATESLAADHPDVITFLAGTSGRGDLHWLNSDVGMARVLEDLIILLMKGETIAFTDLPPGARQKLAGRMEQRKKSASVTPLFASD
jgi:hypothetical protein